MRTISIFILSLCVSLASAGDVSPLFGNAHCGILIKELVGDNTIAAYQNDKSFAPASVMKLVTTATVLEKLSPSFYYMSRLQYGGDIVDGVLVGDLFVKGSGDPTLGSQYFYDKPDEFLDVWVQQIKVAGITSITGALIADASVFDKQVVPDKWIWEDIGNYYGAGCFGLSCFDNRYDLYFKSAAVGDLVQVDHVSPQIDDLTFDSHVVAADNNKDNAYIYGSPWAFEKQIYGTIPAERPNFRIKGAMPNPPLVLLSKLKAKLLASGIDVLGDLRVSWLDDESSSSRKGISMWFSPMLSEIVKVTNKESNNLFAEHLLKTLAINGEVPATINAAIDTMMAFWQNEGLCVDGVRVYDGSGMSRATLLTPDFVVAVIDYMSQSDNSDVFLQSLAVSGEDGTFRHFLDGTSLAGKVKGKSGSMSGVRCYAGIIELSSEKKYSFCIMVNNFTSSSSDMRNAIESYLLDEISSL